MSSGQCELHNRSSTASRLRIDRTAMGGHEIARDGQAQTRTHRTNTLIEAIKDVWQIFRSDTRAAIGDPDHNVSRVRSSANLDNSAFRRMTNGIGQQVHHHFANPERVNIHGWDLTCNRDLYLHIADTRFRLKG